MKAASQQSAPKEAEDPEPIIEDVQIDSSTVKKPEVIAKPVEEGNDLDDLS